MSIYFYIANTVKFSFYYYGPEYIKEGDCVKKNPKELKSKKRRKDSAYYEFIGMSAKDAKILSRTMGTARLLDGSERHCGIKVGFGGFIGLIPA